MIKIHHTIRIFCQIILSVIFIASFDRCATVGRPTGGDKDTIPPEVVYANPAFHTINFNSKKINIGFNEYVQLKDLDKELIISPPLDKKPEVKLKGKGIYFELNREDLYDSTTYNFNFGNAIIDLNEGNPYTNFSYVFSTGETIDSFAISGKIISAFDLQPSKEPFWIMLYKNTEDSVPYKEKPVYIGRSLPDGMYDIGYLKPGTYKLFALKEKTSDFIYNRKEEIIAFSDSLIVIDPALFIKKIQPDSLFSDTLLIDSLQQDSSIRITYGLHVNLFSFQEAGTDTLQYLKDYKYLNNRMIYFSFNNPLTDSVNIELADSTEKKLWYVEEYSSRQDSVNLWITDTLILAKDTIPVIISYCKHDSLKIPVLTHDTILFRKQRIIEVKRKRDEKENIEVIKNYLNISLNFPDKKLIELSDSVTVSTIAPIILIDTSKIRFYKLVDTIEHRKAFAIRKDRFKLNLLHFDFKLEEDSRYHIYFYDSALIDLYGLANDTTFYSFTTKRNDQYGKLNLHVTGMNKPIILQLLENKNEKVVDEKRIMSDGLVSFEYILPGEYKLKVIYDDNQNGKWDPGVYLKNKQPEKVRYFHTIVKIRENWENSENWDMTE